MSMPFQIDPKKVEASLRNGVLELHLQRAEEDKPRRIKVSSS
jgi:HSP20 family protein